jgi:UDP-N-acetylglucosamine transferase subunit ALG13
MIFVTVGSQLSFDRLVNAVDDWASARPHVELFGQIGESTTPPRNFASVSTLTPAEYRERFASADLVVGHAGMGTIIAALELRKPLLIMPRLARLRESRNDNQVGTARHFRSFARIEVVESEADLAERIDHMLAELDAYRNVSDQFGTAEQLIDAIREFVTP